MDQELYALVSHDSSGRAFFDEVEAKIATLAARNLYTPEETRFHLWAPVAEMLVERIRSSDITEVTRIMTFIENTVLDAENYNRTNLGMEILRCAITREAFRSTSLLAATIVYDPTLRHHGSISFDDIRRVFLDTNEEVEKIEFLFSPDATEEDKKTLSEFALPQALPGLGYMLASHPFTGAVELIGIIAEVMKVEMPDTRERLEPIECRSYFDRACKAMGGRILLANMGLHLPSGKALVKYNADIIAEDMKARPFVTNVELIEKLVPFEFPPTIIPTDGAFGDKPNVPHLIFGTAGPLFVVLDYRYGEKRYLLLRKNATETPHSSSVGANSLKFAADTQHPPPSVSVLHAQQHYQFMHHRLGPPDKTLADIEEEEGNLTSSYGALEFFPPTLKTEIAAAAIAFAKKHIRAYIGRVDAIKGRVPDGRLALIRRAAITMHDDRVAQAIRVDISNGVQPFSPLSESFSVTLGFEVFFAGLQK